LMEDLQEQQDLQNEIAQVMSSGNRIADDDELLAELDALESQQQDEMLIGSIPSGPVGTTTAAPRVATAPAPSTTITRPAGSLSEEEEAELAALQQSLN